MNISNIKDCYGCGLCAIVCPKNIIRIDLNREGFYVPAIINKDECINCSLCIQVCAYSDKQSINSEKEIHSYAGWSKDSAIRRKCSSGGIGFELGRTLLKQGYKICAVKYNPKNQRAEHYIVETLEELIPSIGSKYIQSFTVNGFKAIKRSGKYLITGTPCQIDSFRRYIKKYKIENNFVLMDFFCHGVPSKLVWDAYVKLVEKVTGPINYVSWRNKFNGWHDSWAMSIDGLKTNEEIDWHDSYNMLIKGKKGFYNSKLSEGDLFYKFFLNDLCLGKACYNECKYKYNRSSADIRIGDLWGNTYKNDELGVSAVVTFTKRGDDILKHCNCKLIEHPLDIVAEGQMKTAPFMRTKERHLILYLLRHSIDLDKVDKLHKCYILSQIIYNKIKRRLK